MVTMCSVTWNGSFKGTQDASPDSIASNLYRLPQNLQVRLPREFA
jgi:hypothetical protein